MKKIYILIFVLIPFIGISQNSTITGVVTYFFNKYQGDKPDIGAKVYVLDSIQNPKFDYDLYEKFSHCRVYRSLYNSYLKINAMQDENLKSYGNKKRYANEIESVNEGKADTKKYLDEYFAELTKCGCETDEKFEILDKKTLKSYLPFLFNDNAIVKTIAANGDYSINVKPATYYIFIVSKNRTSLNYTEGEGKIYFNKITIKEGQTKDVSCNFDLY